MRKLRFVVTAVALVVGVWLGVAGAGAASVTAAKSETRTIEFHNANCGVTTGAPVIGKATYTRKGNMLKVKWTFTKGLPNTMYTIELWKNTAMGCEEVAYLGVEYTNKHGKASKTFKYSPVEGMMNLFATGWDGGSRNDSLNVTI